MVDPTAQSAAAHVKLEAIRRDNKITIALDSLSRSQRTVAKVAVNNLGPWISTELQGKTLVCTIYGPKTQRRSTKGIIDRRARSAITSVPRAIRKALAKLEEDTGIH